MWRASFEVQTGNRPAVVDITSELEHRCRELGDGLLHVFLPHATAGLAIIETGSGSESDLLNQLDSLLPRDVVYRHQHGTSGHGRDHVLPALIAPFLVLSVVGGRLQLGTWQSVVVVDTNLDNPVRTVELSFISG